jgi:hypothetical protein
MAIKMLEKNLLEISLMRIECTNTLEMTSSMFSTKSKRCDTVLKIDWQVLI